MFCRGRGPRPAIRHSWSFELVQLIGVWSKGVSLYIAAAGNESAAQIPQCGRSRPTTRTNHSAHLLATPPTRMPETMGVTDTKYAPSTTLTLEM